MKEITDETVKFNDLPLEVQLIAANALSQRLPSGSGLDFGVGCEPGKKLARDIKAAFIEMYSHFERASVQTDSGSKEV